jgi:flagellar biosynthesis protein FlhF
MKIKKYVARTFSEALNMVRTELTKDAVILSTEEKKGLRPHVEVTAAMDYDAAEVGAHGFTYAPDDALRGPRTDPAFAAPVVPSARDAGVEALKSELAGLRTVMEAMKNNGYELSLPAKKRALLNFLRERSVREEFALGLCDKAADESELPLLISSDIKIKRQPGASKAVMLAGPTGVGKTTTLAKLAAQAVKAGRKAAIINLDTYRIGATEQIRIYSRILGIPLVMAGSAAEFRSGLAKFASSRDVVFIDTAGRSPRDEAYIGDLAELCRTDVPLELHLLMSACADDEAMIEAHRSYRRLPIDCIAFTKVDEAVRYGSLYNLLMTYGKPVAYLTTGQRVPGDIEYATVSRLASLIVKKECRSC